MKVAIVGAGGRVGSCAAHALQWSGVVSEILLLDIAEELVRGEALDMLHGSALFSDACVRCADLEEASKAEMIIITAGLRRKPDESRLDLINRNVALFLNILDDLAAGGLSDESILLVVSNPVDILTYLAVQRSGLPPERIIGLGTLLDTARFRSLIAAEIEAAPTQVNGFVLGEHGDSMVPIWSSVACNGFSLENHPRLTPAARVNLEKRTKESGAEIIRLKDGAGWAVGVSIAALVDAIVLGQKKILPVSSLQKGAYGLSDVCLSVPTMVGPEGVIKHVEYELWQRELQALRHSAAGLKKTIADIGAF